MSRRGHYQGGHTVISRRDTSWFGFKEPKWAKKPNGKKKKPGKQFKKKRRGPPTKPARRTRPLPGIKPEPSRPNPQTTEVRQSVRKGRKRQIVVEFAAARRRRNSTTVKAPAGEPK
ncbi:hypothetical protein ACVIGB_000853 [Bradyrhizobium sp. USDA 4341]